MSSEERGPAGLDEAKRRSNTKCNNIKKNNVWQDIIEELEEETGSGVEVWQEAETDFFILNVLAHAIKRAPCLFEYVPGCPSFERDTYLGNLVDLTTGGIWVRTDDEVISFETLAS